MEIYVCLLLFIFFMMFIDRFKVLPNIRIFRSVVKTNSQCTDGPSNGDFNHRELSTPFVIVVVTLFCFTAFRYNIGWDYMAYYNTIKFNAITNIVGNNEYLNIWLIELSRKINWVNFYFIVNAFLLIVLMVKTIKDYSKNPWISLLFFLGFPLFYLNSLSVIRIFSAIAITFYGFKYIEKQNFLRFAMTVLIASMFHKSAIITIIFYFLKDIKLKTYKLVIILGLLPIVSSIINYCVVAMFPRYAGYTQYTTSQEGTKAIVIIIFIGIVGLVYRNRITKDNHIANIYYNLFYVGLCIYLMFFNQGTMGHRLSLYGTIYSLLLVPHLTSLSKRKEEQLFFNVAVYSFCIIAFLFTVYVGAETYLPYKTIWISR